MGKTVPSLAEPKMLRWCRKTAGYSIAETAAKIDRSEAELEAWEQGDGGPTFAQLAKLAKLYRRPTAVFYLPEPPADFTVIRDFRRLPAGRVRRFSPELRFLLRTVRTRQEWLSDSSQASGSEPVSFVGSVTTDDDPAAVGRNLRHLLSVHVDEQLGAKDKAAAFRLWRERCEFVGVCIFQSAQVDIEEMRGFAIADSYAPSVLVNARDAYAGRTFTLLHEMVHLLLGTDGVSNLRPPGGQSRSQERRIEQFCNAAAAEALVPAADMSARLPRGRRIDPDRATDDFAALYRVSREVVARRLSDLGFADKAFYERKRAQLAALLPRDRELEPEPERRGEIKIPRAKIVLRDTGRRFARIAVAAFHEGEIGGGELARLLNMKLHHLPKLESELFRARVQTAGEPQE